MLSLSARRAWIEIRRTLHDFPAPKVALRKESVDRNRRHEDGSLRLDTVALRKESVDRNAADTRASGRTLRSLSARRAWIEMTQGRANAARIASLSARRAWIEILFRAAKPQKMAVALRKESVDRNVMM